MATRLLAGRTRLVCKSHRASDLLCVCVCVPVCVSETERENEGLPLWGALGYLFL